MATAHIGVGFALLRRIAEVAIAFHHLLRRAAANAELQTAVGDQVRRAGVFRHIERVFVAHIDHAGADFDFAGARADRRQQRERRAELTRKVVHPEVGAVRAQLFSGDRQIDGLQQHVLRRASGGL